ncbi:hypothetical protein MC885_014175, partial [Smutsia gigantea]
SERPGGSLGRSPPRREVSAAWALARQRDVGSSFFAEELGELMVCVTGAKGLRAQLEESRRTPRESQRVSVGDPDPFKRCCDLTATCRLPSAFSAKFQTDCSIMDGGDEECPEEVYDPRSLYERLQEQKDRKQQEYEEQFKFKNMVRGLDEDETNFLDEVGLSSENKKEVEKKVAVKPVETKNKFSQAKLLAGAVKHKSSESGNSVKRLKSDPDPDDKNQVCVGILPGLGAYSGSSDSESSSDSEGTINATGKIVSSIFRTNTFLEAP